MGWKAKPRYRNSWGWGLTAVTVLGLLWYLHHHQSLHGGAPLNPDSDSREKKDTPTTTWTPTHSTNSPSLVEQEPQHGDIEKLPAPPRSSKDPSPDPTARGAGMPIVVCSTTKGKMVVRVRLDWAPHGAKRFLELVDLGFFSNMSFFRVPPLRSNPIAQFGLSPIEAVRSQVNALPRIKDDSYSVPQEKGYFGFGGSGPDSRTYHLWVARETFAKLSPNFGKNVWDVPVAQVMNPAGLEALDRLAVVGDMRPWGDGPDTNEMYKDPTFSSDFPGVYLRKNFPTIDWFIECHRHEEGAGAEPERQAYR